MLLKAHTKLIQATSVLCAFLLTPGDLRPILAQDASAPQTGAKVLSPAQLDSLVAPIALYPDPLLAQVLAASTYPLDIIHLQQWLKQNSTLKDQALADAVMKQPWDASVQALAALPDVVDKLASDIHWTTELGDAVVAQQGDVMDAVQRMRARAQTAGQLKSNDHMTVQTQTEGSKQVIVIQQADPQVIYVPVYNPVAIWGAAPYFPYPPLFYPPGMALSFGVGVAMGSFWGGGWGWNTGWGGNNIIINNNNFNRNNWARGDRNWRHNAERGRGGNWANRERGGNRERGANRGRGNNSGSANRERGGNRERGANRGRGNNAGNANRERGGNRGNANRGNGNRGQANRGNANRGGGNRGQANRGNANRGGGNRGQANRGQANRGGNRGGANRGSANRGGANRGGGARGGANRGGGNRGGGNRGGGNRGGGNRGGGGGGRGRR